MEKKTARPAAKDSDETILRTPPMLAAPGLRAGSKVEVMVTSIFWHKDHIRQRSAGCDPAGRIGCPL